MGYAYEQLEQIADQTGNDCHLCHQPIVFSQYGNYRHPGGWEVDHLRPHSKAGHNGLTNLRAAHAHCNRKKGNRSNRYVRSQFGVTGTPPSTGNRIWRTVGSLFVIIVGIALLFAAITRRASIPEPSLGAK